jgi:hypothetical protein
MPKQNRVNPFGELVAIQAKGSFMGNRGVLHDSNGALTAKRWTHPHWIICALEFKDRKRTPMTPGFYTELFFFDEATALAAGHRPCAECRREAFNQFKKAWVEGNAHLGFSSKTSIGEIDRVMQQERATPNREKVTFKDELGNLPCGSFFTMTDQQNQAFLVWQDALWEWSPIGYEKVEQLPPGTLVTILTPVSTVNALRAGFIPLVTLSSG